MSNQYTATIYPTFYLGGEELALIAEVRFTHCPEVPATGLSYASGGEPGEPEGVEDVELVSLTTDSDEPTKLDPIPAWLADWIVEHCSEDELIDAIPDGPDPDDARDRERDDADYDRRYGGNYDDCEV